MGTTRYYRVWSSGTIDGGFMLPWARRWMTGVVANVAVTQTTRGTVTVRVIPNPVKVIKPPKKKRSRK